MVSTSNLIIDIIGWLQINFETSKFVIIAEYSFTPLKSSIVCF